MPRKTRRTETPNSASQTTSRASHIDRHVGARVRKRRIMLGLSQQQMADMIGVTYQQTHKYERGINRVSAGRLYEIAAALNVPVAYFYEDIEKTSGDGNLPEQQRMCLDLARNFSRITNRRHKKALNHLARAMASK